MRVRIPTKTSTREPYNTRRAQTDARWQTALAGFSLLLSLASSAAAQAPVLPPPTAPAPAPSPTVATAPSTPVALDEERADGRDRDEEDEPSGRTDPPRYLALASAGMPLRLNVQKDYGQDRFGASYIDLLAGYVLPGSGYRHGFGVGVSWNLGHDGGYVAPIYTADQIVIMPAYLGYLPFSRDVVMVGHLGVPIAVRGGTGPGLEIGDAFLFHLLAGAGIFAEIDLTAFAAGDAGVSALASFEAGIAINYEVLP